MKKSILCIILTLFILISGCSSDEPSSKIDLSDVSEDIAQLAEDMQYNKKTISSSTLIQQDLNAGKISKEESVFLELLSNYYSDNLPDRYQGDDTGGTLQDARMWVYYNWDSLDSDMQEQLEPFYVGANDPKSFHNQDTKSIADSLSIIPSVDAASEVIALVGGTKIYIDYSRAGSKQQALWVKEALIKSWPMHKALLGVEPSIVSVKFVNMRDYGVTTFVQGNLLTEFNMEIKAGMNKAMTQGTTAHELFHCFQFSIPLKFDSTGTKWLIESTAVWAENYVYPEHNSEFKRLPNSFFYRGMNMIHFGSNRDRKSVV